MLRRAVAVRNTGIGPVRVPRARRAEEVAGVVVTAAVVLLAAAGTVVAAVAVCTVAAAVTRQGERAERTGVNL